MPSSKRYPHQQQRGQRSQDCSSEIPSYHLSRQRRTVLRRLSGSEPNKTKRQNARSDSKKASKTNLTRKGDGVSTTRTDCWGSMPNSFEMMWAGDHEVLLHETVDRLEDGEVLGVVLVKSWAPANPSEPPWPACGNKTLIKNHDNKTTRAAISRRGGEEMDLRTTTQIHFFSSSGGLGFHRRHSWVVRDRQRETARKGRGLL